MNKYGAKRTWSELCQRTFASKAECIRGEELRMLEMAGEIAALRYQPKFVLCFEPKITITLDFAYETEKNWVYEDVKGVLTRDFRTKLAWLKEKYGIEVKLIR
jgi:hypothetical protein